MSKPGMKPWFPNLESSEYKWQRDKTVIGALEVPSVPYMNFRSKLLERVVNNKRSEDYEDCLKLWHSLKLNKSFIEACEGVPVSTGCCGLVHDEIRNVRTLAETLNEGWVKHVNRKVLREHGFKLSCFVWAWSNAHGAGKNEILLIRFHALSLRRFSNARRTSLNSLEFSDIVISKIGETVAKSNNSSRQGSTITSSTCNDSFLQDS